VCRVVSAFAGAGRVTETTVEGTITMPAPRISIQIKRELARFINSS
jgi:hypothetical protein